MVEESTASLDSGEASTKEFICALPLPMEEAIKFLPSFTIDIFSDSSVLYGLESFSRESSVCFPSKCPVVSTLCFDVNDLFSDKSFALSLSFRGSSTRSSSSAIFSIALKPVIVSSSNHVSSTPRSEGSAEISSENDPWLIDRPANVPRSSSSSLWFSSGGSSDGTS